MSREHTAIKMKKITFPTCADYKIEECYYCKSDAQKDLCYTKHFDTIIATRDSNTTHSLLNTIVKLNYSNTLKNRYFRAVIENRFPECINHLNKLLLLI